MKYYADLLKLKVFTRDDLAEIIGNAHTANSVITSYQKKGYIKKVRRNLYVVLSLETGKTIANKWLIASKISDKNYISHYSVAELLKLGEKINDTVYVSGNMRFEFFKFEGVRYEYIAPRISEGVVEENGYRYTDIERTLLDCINDFEKWLEFKTLLTLIKNIKWLKSMKLINYLKLYNKQSLYQKTGYLLEEYQDRLGISNWFIFECKKGIKNTTAYLYKSLKQDESREFKRAWRLYIPKELEPSPDDFFDKSYVSSSSWGRIGGHKITHYNWKGNY